MSAPLLRLGYALVAVAELVAVGLSARPVEWLVKPLLTVILAVLAAGSAAPRPRLLLAGLGCAFLGDVLLLVPGTVAFLAGMAAFLGMQVCYLVAFRRAGARPGRPLLAGYAAGWAVGNVLLWPHLGDLRVPILIYSAALVAMAAYGARRGRRVAVGALLFLASDLLIGLGAAGARPPGHDLAVMASYAAAQYLIVTGHLARRPAPSVSWPAVAVA